MQKTSNQSGFALVFMIIIVGAVSVSVSLLLAQQAWDANNNQKASLASLKARYVAEGCLERGLLRLREDNDFSGELNFTILGTDCSVEISDLGGESRQLEAAAVDKGYYRHVVATTTTLSPQIDARWIDGG